MPKRKSAGAISKRSKKSLRQCLGCGKMYFSNDKWKLHLVDSPSCKSSHFPCVHCDSGFCGFSQQNLDKHYTMNTICGRKNNSLMNGTTGKLPSSSKPGTSSHGTSSYLPEHRLEKPINTFNDCNEYIYDSLAPSGANQNIRVSVHDTTRETINALAAHPTSNSVHDIPLYVTNSRSYAGIVSNNMGAYLSKSNQESTSEKTSKPSPTMFQQPTSLEDLEQETSMEFNCEESPDRTTTQDALSVSSSLGSVQQASVNLDFDVENSLSGQSTGDEGSVNSNDEALGGLDMTVDHLGRRRPEGMIVDERPNVEQDIDLTTKQTQIRERLNGKDFHETDTIMMDLFLILRASNAPNALFDRIVDWTKNHKKAFKSNAIDGLTKRKQFIDNMNKTLYTDGIFLKPRIVMVPLLRNRRTSIVKFNFQEMAIRMVTNTNLFKQENLVLNPDNIFGPPLTSDYLGDIHDGLWWIEAMRNFGCNGDNKKLLMPFIFFIDGLKLDKYGKLTAEAVLACCAWFNREARNRGGTWSVFGFVEDQKTFSEQDMYQRNDKAQDYHLMMAEIFREFREVQEAGGMTMDIFIDGKQTTVKAIPVISFIIGDCKGNDLLCLRKGGHHPKMKGMCRDCNIAPDLGDNTCVGGPLLCQFLKKSDIENKTEEELAEISFLKANNCFQHISFGGSDHHNICSATPAELLHAVELGLCEYISESLDMFFTRSSMAIISEAVAIIVKKSKRQSQRDLPDLNPFRMGLRSVKALKAKERFARCYATWLALMNPHVIRKLCAKNKKKIKKDGTNGVIKITRQFLRAYTAVIEDTLLFHRWLKKERYLKTDFDVKEGENDSRASSRIKHFLQAFKDNVRRSGNELKTPKFHQMLHICDYIIKFGPPSSFDGSRGENLGKTIIKDSAQRTNKDKTTLNFDIATRIYEDDLIDQASHAYYRRYKKWPSNYCTETDMILHPSERNKRRRVGPVDFTEFTKPQNPRFHLNVMDHDEEDEEIKVKVDWGKHKNNPPFNFSSRLVAKIASRMYLNCANHGGRVCTTSRIAGYTQIKKGGIIFRAHPWFCDKGPWFDWAYFEWTGFDDPVPAQIQMFIDLTDCKIINEEMDRDEGVQKHLLTSGMWAIVRPGTSPPKTRTDDDDHFDSKISKYFKIDSELYVVPVSAMVAPVAVIETPNIFAIQRDEYNDLGDAITVTGMDDWAESFLPPNINHLP